MTVAGLTDSSENMRQQQAELLSFIARRVRDPSMSDDILQETFVRLLSNGAPGRVANKMAWMKQVALNLIRDHFRKAARHPTQGLTEHLVGDGCPPDEAAIRRENVEMFSQALESLSPLRRAIFIRRKLHGESSRAVAQSLSLTENAVEQHVARAMIILYAEIAKATNRDEGA